MIATMGPTPVNLYPQGLVPGRASRRHNRAGLLTQAQILAWADAHHARTGAWPSARCGPVADAPGETWSALNAALHAGVRGLPGGDSLPRLLKRTGRIGERRGRPPQRARHSLVRRLHADGLSLADIGRILGISRQAAWLLLKRTAAATGQEIGSP